VVRPLLEILHLSKTRDPAEAQEKKVIPVVSISPLQVSRVREESESLLVHEIKVLSEI
jgi:hypothetical protein